MKEYKSPAMEKMLKRGMKEARKRKFPPMDGTMVNLIYETKKNGWHYQVEWINDTRFHEKHVVRVYAFKPPLRWNARTADLFLTKEFK